MRSIVRVQSISPRPQLNNFSRATVPLSQDILLLLEIRAFLEYLRKRGKETKLQVVYLVNEVQNLLPDGHVIIIQLLVNNNLKKV